jgi:hypothetical protein
MAKKKAAEALSRPEKRGPPGPTPLLVIAGLPETTAAPAAATINNDRHSRWRAVASAFTNRDGGIYAEPGAILNLGRLACGFAIAGARDADGVPTPSRIAVAYVDTAGFEQLWEVFGHAVWPIPLRHPDWTWPKGQHWRHEIETVNRVLRHALAAVEANPADALRLRLETRRAEDVLLLPGRNFHLGPERRLVERFRLFMSDKIDAASVEEGVRVERFAYERLAEFYKRMGGRGKRFAVDSRDIVFAKSNYGQDGGQHEIPIMAEITAALLQRTLESRYRFGTPLVPPGFQHDAQCEGAAKFDHEPFDCVTKGVVKMGGDHVNVFPNDVVTGTIVG